MLNIIKVDTDNIESFAELRSSVLMEINGLSDPAVKKNFKNANMAYLNKAIPAGDFIAFMAFEHNRIVSACAAAFYSIAPCRSTPNGRVGCIQNMYTAKEYRRQGIASKLLERTIEEARKKGCSKIVLNATTMGRPLYEKHGFANVEDEMELRL